MTPKDAQDRLTQWLDDVGFKRNPFDGGDAKPDIEPHLEEYFVYPIGFEEMLGKNTAAFYAPHGGGKTACRRMIERSCKVGDTKDKIFCATYDDFHGVIEQAENNLESITARMHIESILKESLPNLLDYFIDNPQLILDKPDALAYMRYFLDNFTDCLTDYYIDKRLKGMEITKRKIISIIDNNELINCVGDYLDQIKLFIALIENKNDKIPHDKLTPTGLLKKLSLLIQAAGFDVLFILIDNIDSLPETCQKPKACFKLIETLAGIKVQNVFFKFFLPFETRSFMEKYSSINPVMVEWSFKRLKEVLQARLIAATKENRPLITTLDMVSQPELRDKIDDEIVKNSKIPRDLIRLGRCVFQTLNRLFPESEYINGEILEKSFKIFTGISEEE